MTANLERIRKLVADLPEAVRVDIEAWDGEPTFRVRGKNFVFASPDGSTIALKLSRDEAAAVVATDGDVEPAAYGLGRHGWVSLRIPDGTSNGRWLQIEEWVRTSYTLVAPRALARQVLDQVRTMGIEVIEAQQAPMGPGRTRPE